MLYLLILIIVFYTTVFIGYIIHWVFHKSFSGPFYKAHTAHHNILYPPTNYISDEYRDAGKDNTAKLFIICFSPFILLFVALCIFKILSLFLTILILSEIIIIGLINNYVHDWFHLKNSPLEKFSYFKYLQKLHYSHHVDQSKNYSIFIFTFDKLFKTYIQENVRL